MVPYWYHATGRLKRTLDVTGTVDSPLEGTADFPFDSAALGAAFRTVSHWRTRDESISGTAPTGSTYYLRPVQFKGEGVPFRWASITPKVAAWDYHGTSLNISEAKTPQGQGLHRCTVTFYLTRRAQHYFWKVLLPLYTLVLFGLFTLAFGADQLSDRTSLSSNMFLASFAVLYVVQDDLPKTDFLTAVDKV